MVQLRLQNNSEAPISSPDVAYDLFSYNDTNCSNSFNFCHSADNSFYTLVGSLDYASTQLATATPAGESASPSTNITGLSITMANFIIFAGVAIIYPSQDRASEFSLH